MQLNNMKRVEKFKLRPRMERDHRIKNRVCVMLANDMASLAIVVHMTNDTCPCNQSCVQSGISVVSLGRHFPLVHHDLQNWGKWHDLTRKCS